MARILINVDYALNVLQTQMETGYAVAHERHSSLAQVYEETCTKLEFLFEVDAIDQDEYFAMADYCKKTFDDEMMKKGGKT